MSESPLAEAKPSSLAEIFSLDPLDLTKQDRVAVVRELRRLRELFEKEDAQPKAAKKPKLESVSKVDLSDLGL